MKIAIIDYGLGNPLSIRNMFKKVGADAQITSDEAQLFEADKLILPGVGHFTSGMQNLQSCGLKSILDTLVLEKKVPVLGICLGMQLMTGRSEESELPGLGWLDAETVKFRFEDAAVKIPHMGWTDTEFRKPEITNSVFEEVPPRFYFVHSYFVKCHRPEDVLCESEYGHVFTSGFVKNNIMGVQFHPEKSHVFGQAFLKQYLDWQP